MPTDESRTRRDFLYRSAAAAGGLLAADRTADGAGSPPKENDETEVSPPEDLMREHGVLKRVMLVYEETLRRIDGSQEFPPETLRDAAQIIWNFVENYHEKLEEDFLFPRFEKQRRLVDLVKVLRAQHEAGRRVTDAILQRASLPAIKNPEERRKIAESLRAFNRMYGPHEAREDTVLFPAFRGVVSAHEFGALGEDFEKREDQLFGRNGFESMVERVAGIEKKLGIYDLAQFTPKA
jgi:hemerythrin-like domain-containing protein